MRKKIGLCSEYKNLLLHLADEILLKNINWGISSFLDETVFYLKKKSMSSLSERIPISENKFYCHRNTIRKGRPTECLDRYTAALLSSLDHVGEGYHSIAATFNRFGVIPMPFAIIRYSSREVKSSFAITLKSFAAPLNLFALVKKVFGAFKNSFGGGWKSFGALPKPVGGLPKSVGGSQKPVGEFRNSVGGSQKPVGGFKKPFGESPQFVNVVSTLKLACKKKKLTIKGD